MEYKMQILNAAGKVLSEQTIRPDAPSKLWTLRYELKLARINFKRAETRHLNEQSKGATDISVKQTKRMYHAAENLRRAAGRLDRAMHDLRLHARLTGEIAKELSED